MLCPGRARGICAARVALGLDLCQLVQPFRYLGDVLALHWVVVPKVAKFSDIDVLNIGEVSGNWIG